MSKDENDKPASAVALRYDGRGAPRVTAKGRGYVAQEIIERARQHQVPLHEDAALVQLLARVELNEEIPEALYRVVARVLAFAYGLSGKTPPLPKKQ
jgi:flagellar biosynthesis protein